jgi:predicted O-linked N-acetylglucosamine transferase (SPINDLY family)
MFLDELTAKNNDRQETSDYCHQTVLENILADDWESAQAALLMTLLDCESEEQERLAHDRWMDSLYAHAEEQVDQGFLANAHKVLNFAYSIAPDDLNILLRLIEVEFQTDQFSFSLLLEREFLLLLTDAEAPVIDQERMYRVVQQLLHYFDAVQSKLLPEEFIPELAIAFIDKSQNKYRAMSILIGEAFLLGEQRQLKNMRAAILEICLDQCEPTWHWYFEVLVQTVSAMALAGQYNGAIALAERCCQESLERSEEDRVFASDQLLSALMEAGRWQEIPEVATRHYAHLDTLIANNSGICNCGPMIASSYFLNYVDDEPRKLHSIRNAIGQLCSATVRKKFGAIISEHSPKTDKKVIRIGYIASTLRKHSVGWLSRWLFAHHNREDFQVFLYNVSHNSEDKFYQQYFAAKADGYYSFGTDVAQIVQQIQRDEIDILVDMDSLALSTTYEVMCCKPAPVQVTWLGWDSSGCPEIDYFIADPYVVPENGQEYYHSKIWRLPETYLAVDGFEMGLPTRRKEDYGIPQNGVIYLCGQKSYKHNPDILKLQMRIIKEVPNSYLLVKMLGDRDSLVSIYQEIASQVGISMDRLRFLERDSDEVTHRANLAIADVVLDTFPYNGATTTLETLWAGIPMVTKVGQAFVARNSYAFMTNVGVSEGIAHSDEEYVDWGIKLGCDSMLRQKVSGRLLQSRKSSPLWNTARFAIEMENAYRQMWNNYVARVPG